MSQNVGTKLCSANGCQTRFNDNGTHNCCSSHSSCYESDLAEYQPNNCNQCQEWISLLLNGPSEVLQEVLREKLSAWISQMQMLRKERDLPGSVVQDEALRELIFGFDSVVSGNNFKNAERQSPTRGLQKKRPTRRRVIISDDSDTEEEDGPPEKKGRGLLSSDSEEEPFEMASVSSEREVSEIRTSERTESENCSSEHFDLEPADSENPISERADPEDCNSEQAESKNCNSGQIETENCGSKQSESREVGRGELPSMEEVAKTMNWLVQSVGNIQNMLLQKQVVKYESVMSSSISKDTESLGAISRRNSYKPDETSKRSSVLTANAVNGNAFPRESTGNQENTKEFEHFCLSTHNEPRKYKADDDVWVPLPDDFKLDRTGLVPRVRVPVGNKWVTLSANRCKVHFRSTIPFIKYVDNGEDDEPVPVVKSTEKNKASTVFTDNVTFAINHSNGGMAQRSSSPVGTKNYIDSHLIMSISDEDAHARGNADDLNTLWTKFIEGKGSNWPTGVSFLKIIFNRGNMTDLHAALSAPQIGVEDSAHLLKIKLRKLPVSSYREEKGARAQLLRLMNSLQGFQSLITPLKTTVENCGDREASVLMRFSKSLEAPLLSLEGAFRYALTEFFRLRQALRQKLFRGLKLNFQVSELIRSSPFSEDLFHPVVVNEFLSHLGQQNLMPSDVSKKKAAKKVIFSKKYFALPKRKVVHKGKNYSKTLQKPKYKTNTSKRKFTHTIKSKRGNAKSEFCRDSFTKEKTHERKESGGSEQEFSEEY